MCVMKVLNYRKVLLTVSLLQLVYFSAQKNISKSASASNQITQNVMQQRLTTSLKFDILSEESYSPGKPISISGKGMPGTKVHVFLYVNWQNRQAKAKAKMNVAVQEKQTTVNSSGEWYVSFLPLHLSENQYDVSVSVSAFLSQGSYSSEIVSRIFRLKND